MNDQKIVNYERYCKTCKNYQLEESEEVCDECLRTPVNIDSHKPINWQKRGLK